MAAALELAQQTAIDAAAAEAAARAGFGAVFLNIARRSQGIVHRQLRTIDEAERAESDPDQLARLFRLDHLATRERRNTENLLILGGGQAGRQWREPVSLVDVVRSAVSEAVQYDRVTIGRMPPLSIIGGGVAHLVHLVAELLDNAISFSPPEAHIEVRANLVGRGLVIDIEDEGLGVEPEQRDQLNAMLAEPADFEVLNLSEDFAARALRRRPARAPPGHPRDAARIGLRWDPGGRPDPRGAAGHAVRRPRIGGHDPGPPGAPPSGAHAGSGRSHGRRRRDERPGAWRLGDHHGRPASTGHRRSRR